MIVPPKESSPWLYVLLGCGAIVALMCLGSAVFALFLGNQALDSESAPDANVEQTNDAN
jgi:hypothetical protein